MLREVIIYRDEQVLTPEGLDWLCSDCDWCFGRVKNEQGNERETASVPSGLRKSSANGFWVAQVRERKQLLTPKEKVCCDSASGSDCSSVVLLCKLREFEGRTFNVKTCDRIGAGEN